MKVLDLFAGTGWGVACKWLGIEEMGVEIMPEAVATRTANGMETIFGDVWDGLEGRAEVPSYDGLIASPPCQTYSMAGRGAGREALDEVVLAVNDHLYKDPAQLREFGEKHDPRTALVLTPLAYIWRDKPSFVVLEQVPTVQPVWEAYAVIMREWGYSVETAVLNAEQYGVPQTRRRSILVARLDGPVSLPAPTHSRYYPRDPKKLDAGVLPWVSMAEALGWKAGGEFTQNNKLAHQAVRAMDQPAPTVTAGHDSGNRGFLGGGDFQIATPEQVATLQSYPAGWGFTNRPAMTVTGHGMLTRSPSGQKKAVVDAADAGEYRFRPPFDAETAKKAEYKPQESGYLSASEMFYPDAINCSPEENAMLQSYPSALRSNYGTGGDPKARGERTLDQPAATVTSKIDRNKWVYRNGNQQHAAKRAVNQPAPTVHFGQRSNKVEWMDESAAADVTASGIRVSPDQASALQSYEKPFIWCGPKSKVYLQIGNAVPPVLAHAVLSALVAPSAPSAPSKPKRQRRKLL